MDEETVKKVAKAAHIALSGDELVQYGAELGRMLGALDILDNVPDDENYTVNPIEVANVLREDVPCILIDPYVLLKDMKTYENYVRGPRLL